MRLLSFLIILFIFTGCDKLGHNTPAVKIDSFSESSTSIIHNVYFISENNEKADVIGACCSTSPMPTFMDQSAEIHAVYVGHRDPKTGVGIVWIDHYKCTFDSLLPNTEYHIKGWARKSGNTYYSDEKIISTLKGIPILETSKVTSISAFTAKCGGNISYNGGSDVISRGVCWKVYEDKWDIPSVEKDNHTHDGNGSGHFESNISGLLSNNINYCVRAYATNEVGTGYGDTIIFSTAKGIPIVANLSAKTISLTTASFSGVILDQGGAPVTSCGFCLSKKGPLPTLQDCDLFSNEGSKTAEFLSIISTSNGLIYNISYDVRAYATNSFGTGYAKRSILFLFYYIPPKSSQP